MALLSIRLRERWGQAECAPIFLQQRKAAQSGQSAVYGIAGEKCRISTRPSAKSVIEARARITLVMQWPPPPRAVAMARLMDPR